MEFSSGLLRFAIASHCPHSCFKGSCRNVRAGSLSYTIIDLGGLGGVSNTGFVSEAFGVNATGQVVGDSVLSNGTDLRAFRTDPGGQPMNDLGGNSSTAYAINDSGQSSGQSILAGNLSASARIPTGSSRPAVTWVFCRAAVSASAKGSTRPAKWSATATRALQMVRKSTPSERRLRWSQRGERLGCAVGHEWQPSLRHQ